MKVYITARFQGEDNRQTIETLSHAVREAEMQDFCFVRDVEHYQHTFDSPQELWQRTHDELNACDALLIDVSDRPTGGRVIECGMAYALKKRIFVVVRKGVEYKGIFDGIASTVIEYETPKDLAKQLKKYDQESNFNFTDKTLLFVVLLFLGISIGWGAAQYFVPLGIIATTIYWVIIRHFLVSMRAFDRIVIFIPLALIWLAGMGLSDPIGHTLSAAWTLMYWLVVLVVLKKLKFLP
jgi:nucleoside 2-deoxyribosyltransferase